MPVTASNSSLRLSTQVDYAQLIGLSSISDNCIRGSTLWISGQSNGLSPEWPGPNSTGGGDFFSYAFFPLHDFHHCFLAQNFMMFIHKKTTDFKQETTFQPSRIEFRYFVRNRNGRFGISIERQIPVSDINCELVSDINREPVCTPNVGQHILFGDYTPMIFSRVTVTAL